MPEKITVIELRKKFGLGWRVWLSPKRKKYFEGYQKRSKWSEDDSIPRQARVGDLVLMYFSKGKSQIAFICEVTKQPIPKKGEKWGKTKMVYKLGCPLGIKRIKQHKELKDAGFVKNGFVMSQDITAFWPEMYQLIIDLNPQAKKVLREYAPECKNGELLTLPN